MYACYRREEAADATTMLDAAAAVLAEYPESVIRHVTDPRTGLPGRMKWPPNIAEIREACEREYAPILAEQQRQKRIADTRALLSTPAVERDHRATYAELKQRHGENWGINPPLDVDRAPSLAHYHPDRPLTSEERQAMYASRKNENKGA